MNTSVVKLDVDWKPPKKWREEWIETRKLILNHLGYKVVKVVEEPSSSRRGSHYWLHLDKKVSDMTLVRLSYLLGDDETRTRINFLRVKRGIKNWNKLFSKVVWRSEPNEICKKCHLRKRVIEITKSVNKQIEMEESKNG